MDSRETAMLAAKTLYEKKAQDIVVLDVQHLTIIADYFVIASGRAATQVRSLGEDVDDKLSEFDAVARRKEGMQEGRWIVLDYGSVLVHIFHEQEREYYNLERLWTDGSNKLELDFAQED